MGLGNDLLHSLKALVLQDLTATLLGVVSDPKNAKKTMQEGATDLLNNGLSSVHSTFDAFTAKNLNQNKVTSFFAKIFGKH